MNRIALLYRNAFGGLSRSAWMLALVMLINRSGTMVLPFLSVYVTDALGYSVREAGIMLSCFGIGSMIGAFAGGILSDRYGHFIVQFLSLVLSGLIFIMLAHVTEFYRLVTGILILSAVGESFRPANSASLSFYTKPENVSRAFSLNRMAINLGFSVGPAIGGLLAAISYGWLFIVDGTTCIAAGMLFLIYFRTRKGYKPPTKSERRLPPMQRSVYRDTRYLVFIAFSSLFAIIFFQLFLSLPLYYRDVYLLPEKTIGSLLALNGIFVFTVEMILVYLLQRQFSLKTLVFAGLILLGASFILFNIFHGVHILVISMIIFSLAEIFTMPFMVTYVVRQSSEHNRGAYMGLYTMSYSIAHVVAPFLGSLVISTYNFQILWWGTGIFSVFIAFGFLAVISE